MTPPSSLRLAGLALVTLALVIGGAGRAAHHAVRSLAPEHRMGEALARHAEGVAAADEARRRVEQVLAHRAELVVTRDSLARLVRVEVRPSAGPAPAAWASPTLSRDPGPAADPAPAPEPIRVP